MSTKLNTPVYSFDLRNHGSSPWAFPYDNWTLSCDLANYICDISKKHGGKKIDLIGFSLGAKVSLLTGHYKQTNSILNKIISIDMAPGILESVEDALPNNANAIYKVVKASANYNSKQGILTTDEQDHSFVKQTDNDNSWLENLEKHFLNANNGNYFSMKYFTDGFKIGSKHLKAGEPVKHCMPILEMKSYLDEIYNWPTDTLVNGDAFQIEKMVIVPVLFLRATQCQMFPKTEYFMDLIEELYPNYRIQDFDCWHPIHVLKKEEYLDSVTNFLKC